MENAESPNVYLRKWMKWIVLCIFVALSIVLWIWNRSDDVVIKHFCEENKQASQAKSSRGAVLVGTDDPVESTTEPQKSPLSREFSNSLNHSEWDQVL
ncbi:hypothetical protein VTL71DRAFT_13030, partial [Oculimacula yallundae]